MCLMKPGNKSEELTTWINDENCQDGSNIEITKLIKKDLKKIVITNDKVIP